MARMRLLLLAALLFCTASSVFAQSPGGTLAARPDRGFTPGGAYSVSNLDSVSLTGGSLNVSIPLASLPPIAGGNLGVTITATYNSKLWDVGRSEVRVQGTIGRRTYVEDVPQVSKRGGWRIGGPGYDIIFRNAHEDFDYDQPQQQSEDESDWPWVKENREWWKAYIVTPDGAEHEIIPTSPAAFYGGKTHSYLIGSFSNTPNGFPTNYRTVDGTYLSVLIKPDRSWIITSPDGTQATLSSDGQRIKDANNNSILIYGTDGATHYKDEQTGREIRVTGDETSGYQVWYQSVSGIWQHVDVNIGTTRVQGKFYRVNAWNAAAQTETGEQGAECIHDAVLDKELSVIREIVYPATEPGEPGRRFAFEYNSDAKESFTTGYKDVCGIAPQSFTTTSSLGFGELSRMTTPTGAFVDYTYNLTSTHRFPLNVDDITRNLVKSKKVTHDGGVVDTWTYDINSLGGGGSVINPDGTSSAEAAYVADPGYSFQSGSANGMGGHVFHSLSGNTLVERRWRSNPGGSLLIEPSGLVAVNPVVEAEYTSLIEGGVAVRMSAKTYQYDLNGNLLQTKEYDWFDPALATRDSAGVPQGVPTAAILLRETNTSYYNTATDASSANLYSKRTTSGSTLVINAPQESVVGASRTRFSYDNQAYGLAPTSGNVTSVNSLNDRGDADAANDQWVTTSKTYDGYGNVKTATDANGHVTDFFYEDSTHAMPTKVVVDPLNGTGQQTTLYAYDYWAGLVTTTTDANGQINSFDYTNQLTGLVDPFGRVGVAAGPAVTVDGVSRRRKIFTTYNDSLRQVTVETDLKAEGDRLLKRRTTSDMLGRVVLTEQSEDGAGFTIFVRSAYEQAGRVSFTSNPMRAEAAATDGWTRTTKDEAGRVVEVATYKGVTQPPSTGTAASWTGSVKTAYYAEFVTMTDPAGRARRSRTDALGRLVRVDEAADINNTLGDYQSPAQPTSYVYNALNNITTVSQGGQTRTFVYDSLSRLKSAKNPESGTITYQYDPAGDLTQKTDARGVVTTYGYDALNRPTSRSYSDGTPSVAYFYDSQSLPAGAPAFDRGLSSGKLLAVTYGGGSLGNYTGDYDAMGQPRLSRQVSDTGTAEGVKTYSMAYEYDLAGNLKSRTYPSGRVVSTSYDDAGRISMVTNVARRECVKGQPCTAPATRPYASSFSYTSHGAVAGVLLGNGLWEHTDFNNRLQPTEIGLGTAEDNPNTNSDKMRLTYDYGTTGNNGNILSQRISVPGLDVTQSYAYDPLNRLLSAREVNNTTPCKDQTGAAIDCWKQVYKYDRFGNRTFNTSTTFPALPANLADMVNNPAIDPATNRLVEDQDGDGRNDYQYDPAGNVVRDAQGRTFTFDAENKQTAFNGGPNINTGGANYVYDGDGRRIKQVTPGGTTVFVYDASGAVVAEYSNGAQQPGASGTKYLTTDTLGSPRTITDQSGGIVSRHDYAPFGEELIAGRTNEYRQDSLRRQFTGQERDRESGLDFFDARYYSSTQGRFTSIDPLAASGKPSDPQTWNRYAYVLNNPLRFVDPTGLDAQKKDDTQNQQPVAPPVPVLPEQENPLPPLLPYVPPEEPIPAGSEWYIVDTFLGFETSDRRTISPEADHIVNSLIESNAARYKELIQISRAEALAATGPSTGVEVQAGGKDAGKAVNVSSPTGGESATRRTQLNRELDENMGNATRALRQLTYKDSDQKISERDAGLLASGANRRASKWADRQFNYPPPR